MSGDLRGVANAIALSRGDDAQHPAEPVLGLRLQCRADPGRGGRAVPAFGGRALADVAAGAMALSSVFVVGNALRLRRAGGDARAPA